MIFVADLLPIVDLDLKNDSQKASLYFPEDGVSLPVEVKILPKASKSKQGRIKELVRYSVHLAVCVLNLSL